MPLRHESERNTALLFDIVQSPCRVPPFPQKIFTVPRIAEGFCAAGAGRRQRSGDVCEFEAILGFRAAYELMYEASVETVSRPDGINSVDHRREFRKFFSSFTCDSSLGPAFNDH